MILCPTCGEMWNMDNAIYCGMCRAKLRPNRKLQHVFRVTRVIFWLALCLGFMATFAFAQENRLAGIAKEKQRLEEQAERGRLLIENAQFKYEKLLQEENRIKTAAKAKAEKEKAKEQKDPEEIDG